MGNEIRLSPSELLDRGYKTYSLGNLQNTIYYRTGKGFAKIYHTTDSGKIIKTFHGLESKVKDKIKEWEKNE